MKGSFQVMRAALMALAMAFLIGQRSFTDFEKIRIKVVDAPIPASGRELTRAIDDPAAHNLIGGDPDALIATIQNTGAAGDFLISIDGSAVCTRKVPAGRSRRIDCTLTQWVAGRDVHQLSIAGPHDSWDLSYFEVATHHGNTSGFSYLVVLPQGSARYVRPPLVVVLAGGLAALWLLLFAKSTSFPRWPTLVHRSVRGIAVVALAVVIVAPYITPFLIILETRTLTSWLALIFLDRLWPGLRWVATSRVTHLRDPANVARAVIVGAVVCLAFWSPVRSELNERYGRNYSGFLRISREAFERNPVIDNHDQLRRELILVDNSGYDGQFMYYMAFDPLLMKFRDDPARYRETVDAAPYRFGRIGFSVLTRLLARNRSQYPATMMRLLIVAVGALAFIFALEAQQRTLTPLVGGIVMFIPGFLTSLLAGLPEPLAGVGMVCGVLLWKHQRIIAAGVLLAASLLVRETGMIFVICMAVADLLKQQFKRAALLAALAFGPLIAWRSYVVFRLFPDWGASAFTTAPADFDWPFAGVRELWMRISSGEYYAGSSELARAGYTYPLLLVAALTVAIILTWHRPTAMNVAATCYGVLAVCLNYPMVWVHVGNTQRLTYELFVALALCTLSTRSYPVGVQRALIAFWCASAWYTFYGSTDPIRSAFLEG